MFINVSSSDCIISRILKGKVYRSVVRPAILYGSECWPTTKNHERQLHSAEMRMLRWACGWTRLDRIRNEDVRAVMQTAPVQLKLREQRLRWYGHVLRRSAGQEGNGTRSTRQATARSPKEKVEGRHQDRPHRSESHDGRCLG